MPTHGVRLVFTVALLIVAACQSPATEESPRACPQDALSGDVASALRREVAGPVVNVRVDPPNEEPPELQADSPLSPADPRQLALRQFTYDQTPLGDVINDISQIAGVNIVVNWRSLANHNITRRTPVSLDLTGVSAAKVLDVLTDDLSGGREKFGSVYWLVDDGVVRIATGSALNTTLDTRVFSVGDLLMVAPDFEGPRLNLDMSGSVYESIDNDDDGPSRAEAAETLIELVKDTIGEDMWQPAGKGSVSIRGEQMIVTQTPLGWLLMRRR